MEKPLPKKTVPAQDSAEEIHARDEKIAFSKQVQEIFSRALRGELEGSIEESKRDVRRVAFGLAGIRFALDRYLADAGQGAFVETGAREAFEIFAALTEGNQHPVWDFLEGVRQKGRPKPNKIELVKRSCIVGFARAYEIKAEVEQGKAIRTICEVCNFADGFSFTEEMVRGWNRRFQEADEKLPDAFAETIIEVAEKRDPAIAFADRVLNVGRFYVWQYWSVPKTK
jgi:hypothetical protein